MLSRRRFVILGGSALAGAAGVGVYAWQVEPHWTEIIRERMPLEHLSDQLVGKTLLQLSDLHVPRVDSNYLIRELRRAQELAPDFVTITGDFVNRTTREYGELARVLEHLPRGRIATIAALGNHDYGLEWRQLDLADRVSSVLADAGAIVLRNQALVTGGVQFVGLGDLWSPEFGPFGEQWRSYMTRPGSDARGGEEAASHGGGALATLQSLAPNQPTIILAHNPDAQDLPIWDGVRAWVLAGHTHGGQVKPPFLPPPVLPVRNKRYTAGKFVVGAGRTLYINRGLGHLIQVRFNVRPEMTLFTLERAEHAV